MKQLEIHFEPFIFDERQLCIILIITPIEPSQIALESTEYLYTTMPLVTDSSALLINSMMDSLTVSPSKVLSSPMVKEISFDTHANATDSLTHSTTVSTTTSASLDEDEDSVVIAIVKTLHKIQEERGFETEEPLLKANPNRFVLFPIQDDEVRTNNYYIKCYSLLLKLCIAS
jgi:hypothetical protein